MAKIRETSTEDKKKSLPKFNIPDTPQATSTEHPNDDVVYRGPNGTTIVSHTKNGEDAFSIIHASGSRIDMHPDGAVVMTSQNGQYNVVFGENRMLVTGAQDIVVQGGGSLRVDGDYNMAVKGNMMTTVDGSSTMMAAKGMNFVTPEGFSVAANETTMRSKGKTAITADSSLALTGDEGIGLTASKGNLAEVAKNKTSYVSGVTHVNNPDKPVLRA
jgi:hypothetical protein